MYQVPNLTLINNGTVTLDDAEEVPVLDVEILAGANSDPENLKFTWNCTH